MAIASIKKIYVTFNLDAVPRSAGYPAVLQTDALTVTNSIGNPITGGTWVREYSIGLTTDTVEIQNTSPVQVGRERSTGTAGASVILSWTPSGGTPTVGGLTIVSTYNLPSVIYVSVILVRHDDSLIHLKRALWGSGKASLAYQNASLYATAALTAHATLTIPFYNVISELEWDTPNYTPEFPFRGPYKTCFVLKNQYGIPVEGFIQLFPKLQFAGYVYEYLQPIRTYKVSAGQVVTFDKRAEGTYTVVATPTGFDAGSTTTQEFTLAPPVGVIL